MNSRTIFALVLVGYITLASLQSATGRSLGLKYHHHFHNSNHNRLAHPHAMEESRKSFHPKKHTKTSSTSWRLSDEDDDYELDDDDEGTHPYLMTKDAEKSSKETITEDSALTQAFEKHMGGASNPHDVYAYQLPSDLWFIVRYKKEGGEVEKYMNVVDSFTNYLEKLEETDAQTVSVNVKGVETVFRLTPKRKTDN